MNAEAIMTISAAVVGLTQLLKWMGMSNRYGSVAVMGLSLVGILAWAYSQEVLPARTELFSYFAAWIAVATSAAGVFGFTRAAHEQLTKTSSPPPGAGNSPTSSV
jgi:hypothetical protein